MSPLAALPTGSASRSVDARLVLTRDPGAVASGKLEKLIEWFDRTPCATLVLSETPFQDGPAEDAEAAKRAIGFAGRLSEDDLVGRLSTMCVLRQSMEAMQHELDALKRRDKILEDNLRRVDDDLRLAGAVQRDLLGFDPPDVAGIDVHTLYRPAETVSGDTYDVARLDDRHVAISLADVTGHGFAAALLTAFVKRGLKSHTVIPDGSRPAGPDLVLKRLNEDILDARLQECQFVTAIHAVYDESTRVIRWAHGGAPYPILVRRGERPRRLVTRGTIVGAVPDAVFEVAEVLLRDGDRFILHTDGLEALLLGSEGGLGLGKLEQTDWFRDLGQGNIPRMLSELEHRLNVADPEAWQHDDVSAIVLEAHDSPRNEREPAAPSWAGLRLGS
jgi:serine phosphatase RsbU (regulator of sigma subunit)